MWRTTLINWPPWQSDHYLPIPKVIWLSKTYIFQVIGDWSSEHKLLLVLLKGEFVKKLFYTLTGVIHKSLWWWFSASYKGLIVRLSRQNESRPQECSNYLEAPCMWHATIYLCTATCYCLHNCLLQFFGTTLAPCAIFWNRLFNGNSLHKRTKNKSTLERDSHI